MTKKHEEIPPMPKQGKFAMIVWFATFRTGKFLAVLITILVLVGIFTTFKLVITTDPKTGEKKLDKFEIDNVDVKVNVGKDSKRIETSTKK